MFFRNWPLKALLFIEKVFMLDKSTNNLLFQVQKVINGKVIFKSRIKGVKIK